MGEAQTHHFYDFRIFEPVTKPQNQHYLSLETPGHLNKIKKIHGTFENMIFLNLGIKKRTFLMYTYRFLFIVRHISF